jgi:hypothetical protein
VFAAAVAAVVAVLPALPAGWQGVTHWSLVGASTADEYGTVRVETCTRGALLLDWTCRGRFKVNDPMAEPYPPMDDVTVVNDARFHSRGTLVDAAKKQKSRHAYLWGGIQQARSGALWAGVLLCLAAAVLAVARRGRRVRLPSTLLVLGVLLFVAVHPYW